MSDDTTEAGHVSVEARTSFDDAMDRIRTLTAELDAAREALGAACDDLETMHRRWLASATQQISRQRLEKALQRIVDLRKRGGLA
jgi:hypothetical protein